MKFHTVHLATDYPGKISNFAEAKNSFLENLPNDEYVLFVEEDEEIPRMLLDYISRLKPEFPYYNIRRINLLNGRYIWHWNPMFVSKLCSNKMRFVGTIHEQAVPRWPHGRIDIPAIHNSSRGHPYPVAVPAWYNTKAHRVIQALYKLLEAWRGEF